MLFFNEPCDADFEQGYGRSQCGHEKGKEEKYGDEASERHVGKQERQSLEYEPWAFLRIQAECEYCRHYRAAGYQGEHQVSDCSPCRIEGDIGLLACI